MDFTKLPNYQAALSKFTEAVNADKPKDEQDKLYNEAMTIMADEMMETLGHQSAEQLNDLLASNPLNQKMSAEEIKFFNDINTEVGTKQEIVFPETLINSVFEELTVAHPLLDLINFQSSGLRLKAIVAGDKTGTAVWGQIAGDIKGQLDATFKEVPFDQNKLTVFVVIPNDALENGYDWLKTFIIAQISESMALALETAIVMGDGNNQPVGLMKDLSKGTVSNGVTTYADKGVAGDLSAMTPETAPKLLAPLMQKLSINEKGVPVAIDGQVILLVSNSDLYTTLAKFTTLNSLGSYTTQLPFGVKIIPSIAVPAGKGVLFTANRYDAFVGGMKLQEFDQTLAIEDLHLYTNKAFYYGKSRDNNTAVLLNMAASA